MIERNGLIVNQRQLGNLGESGSYADALHVNNSTNLSRTGAKRGDTLRLARRQTIEVHVLILDVGQHKLVGG